MELFQDQSDEKESEEGMGEYKGSENETWEEGVEKSQTPRTARVQEVRWRFRYQDSSHLNPEL